MVEQLLRRVGNSGQSSTEPGDERSFDTIVRGKERRGYKRVDVASSTPTPTTTNKAVLKEVAAKALAGGAKSGPLHNALVYMVDRNRHDIIKTSGGMLSVDVSGVVKTPLGIVSSSNLHTASSILDKVMNVSPSNRRVLTEDYLSLVPQKVTGRSWADTFFADQNAVDTQRNLLRQLRSSLDWYESSARSAVNDNKADTDAYNDLFNCSLSLETDKKVLDRIEKMFKSSINRNHPSSRLSIKNVFTMTYNAAEQKKFDEVSSRLGNVKQLWHGTDAGNVLSILREGLYCPPLGDAKFKTSGRMFGAGRAALTNTKKKISGEVYFSDQSTKSLNYSYGYWSGTRNNHCFMFLADVVMGNEYRPNRDAESGYRFNPSRAYFGTDKAGRPFDSISVKGGTCGVVNNEMIV